MASGKTEIYEKLFDEGARVAMELFELLEHIEVEGDEDSSCLMSIISQVKMMSEQDNFQCSNITTMPPSNVTETVVEPDMGTDPSTSRGEPEAIPEIQLAHDIIIKYTNQIIKIQKLFALLCSIAKVLSLVYGLTNEKWSGLLLLNSIPIIYGSVKMKTVPLGFVGLASVAKVDTVPGINRVTGMSSGNVDSDSAVVDIEIGKIATFSFKALEDHVHKIVVDQTVATLCENVKLIKQVMDIQRNLSQTFQDRVRKIFKKLLYVEIFDLRYTPNEQTKAAVHDMMRNCATDEWNEWLTFLINGCLRMRLEPIYDGIANITSHLLRQVKDYLDDKKKQQGHQHRLDTDSFHKAEASGRGDVEGKDKGELTITLIGHGDLSPTQRLPCLLYFMNPFINSITLYSPWGCTVDANVVYGIVTGTMEPEDRMFDTSNDQFYTGNSKTVYNKFNMLQNEGQSLVPTATFHPIEKADPAYKHLMYIQNLLKREADGLVISYFSDDIQLPEAPLWMVANSMAFIGYLLDLKINFRYAACLSYSEEIKAHDFVPIHQYYHAPPETPSREMSAKLTNKPGETEEWNTFVATYKSFNKATLCKSRVNAVATAPALY